MNHVPSPIRTNRGRVLTGRWLLTVGVTLAFSVIVLARNPQKPAQNQQQLVARVAPVTQQPASSNNLEPIAMQSLKAMSDQLRAATSFSFTARIMREEPGTNGQMLDFFRTIRVQVQRPNKMRLMVASDSSTNQVWYDGQNLTMMPESAKFYTIIPAPPTLDATLAMMKDKMRAHMPLLPFLRTDLYSIASDRLQSANEVGTENIGNRQFLHLAFTEPDADWQLWLGGPNQILPRRLAIIYKMIPNQPRLVIEFSNWNLNAEIPADAFVFSKPQGAVAANWEQLRQRQIQQGRKAQ